MGRYSPFENKKQLLISAMNDAILWEESRIDAGVCESYSNGNDGGRELRKTKGRIRAYARLRDELQPVYEETFNEVLDRKISEGSCELVSFGELMDRLEK